MQKPLRKKKRDIGGIVLTVLFSLVCILYVMPIVEVLINSFKTHSAINTDTFALPNAGTFAGTSNYVKGMTFGNYPFLKSLLYSIVITILSVTLILLCTSMAAWFISRVGGRFSRLFYLGCVFSMIVPFQMVMFPLVSVANDLYLNTPWTIPVIYLGFGAGLFARRRWSVFYGTVIGGLLRFLAHYLVGALVWGTYMPDEFFGMSMTSPWFYSLLYNGSYMLPDIILCAVVFALLYRPLKKYFTGADLIAA